MTRMFRLLAAVLIAALMAACGGGGGSPGTTATGGTTTATSAAASTATGVDTSTTGGTQTAAAGSLSLTVRNAAGTEVTAVGSTDQGRAVATVTDGSNRPVAGAIVVFSQADASLVTFAPEAGTALTDANGQATIDFKATNTTKTGAVSVVAQVLVGTTTLTAKKAIQITGTAAAVEVPTSMLFLDASPASIVIKGAGGSGRSESSTLRFKVVNAASTPIRGAVVNFAVSNPGVTLNIPSATSDAEGVVVTTVTSGTQPLSVVVTATAAANATATVPSSALSVSNGLTVAGGLEIVAAKYNIDGGVTGTETDVSAFLRDVNGNLVPDGTITSFTTDFGAVGSSSAGACSTVNGTCKVKFRVQEPRGTGVATVRATVQLPGNAVPLVDTIAINMANSGGARALSNTDPVTVATTLTLAGTCKDTFALFSADNFNRPLAAGTVVTAVGAGKSVAVSIASGSPVEDSLSGVPTSLRVAVDATAASPACAAAGGAQETTTFELKFTSPGGVSSSVPLTIRYPR